MLNVNKCIKCDLLADIPIILWYARELQTTVANEEMSKKTKALSIKRVLTMETKIWGGYVMGLAVVARLKVVELKSHKNGTKRNGLHRSISFKSLYSRN